VRHRLAAGRNRAPCGVRLTTVAKLRGVLSAGVCFMVVLVGGCASGNGRGAVGGPDPGQPLPGDMVALRVEFVGGFVTPQALVTRLPVLTVYHGGRVLVDGPPAAGYPAPAMPTVQLLRISRADVDRLVRLARAAGVGTATDFGQPMIADAASTRFTVHDAAGVSSTEVYALTESGASGAGVNEKQRAARARLSSLYAALSDLPATLGSGAVSAAQPYTPSAVAVVATTLAGDDQSPGASRDLAWPGPTLPGQRIGVDSNCVTVTGAELARVLSVVRSATTATRWTSAGMRWSLMFRPLLPDESGCASLAK
jgi:hypothetical protein